MKFDRLNYRFSIVITVYEEYELFRQLFESIMHYLYPLSYKEIVIVDDYSTPNGLLRQYEDYLELAYPFVKLIKGNEFRYSFHNVGKDFSLIGVDPSNINKSNGHAFSLWKGVSGSSSEFILCLDADSVLLAESEDLLIKLADLFDRYPLTMVIGQLAGLMTNEIKEIDRFFPFSYATKPNPYGGLPGSPAFACRRAGWTVHEIAPFAESPKPMGWVARDYGVDLVKRGFRLLNFPILSNGYVFHAGGGILRSSRIGRKYNNAGFGLCAETRKTYGPKTVDDILHDWYAGRLMLRISSEQYERYLKGKYTEAPFDVLQAPLDESLLCIPPGEVRPVRMGRKDSIAVWGEKWAIEYERDFGRIEYD